MCVHRRISEFPGLIGLCFLAACATPVESQPEQTADIIFHGGDIITMDPERAGAEAVAVKGGLILGVGEQRELQRRFRGDTTEIRNLEGNTLIPGFIDAHSHFIGHAVPMTLWSNIASPPVGQVERIADVVAEMEALQRRLQSKSGDWLIGFGYDQDLLAEQRHLTRDDLDPAFPDNPVMLIHVSGHGAVLNSAAFTIAGIDADTPVPPGSSVARKPGSREPAGLLMEGAFFQLFPLMPKASDEQTMTMIEVAQQSYAENGYTTIQDGATDARNINLLRRAASEKRLFLDVVSLAYWTELERLVTGDGEFGPYDGRYRLAGVKLMADGSPQGKTAFFTQPFVTPGFDGESDWRGAPNIEQQELNRLTRLALDNEVQVYTHANGDAAIDMAIEAQRAANSGADRRSVVIHTQFARPDQLDSFRELGMVPSFFSNHAFFWGDVHVSNLGQDRAFFLSPLRSADERGIRFTNHSDFGVTPLNPMFILWSAVNRVSRSGQVIGPDERVEPLVALKGITIDAAYQYFEEQRKGSIETGKLADLVILDDNPLRVPPDAIKDIEVLETIKEGKTVYRR